MRSLKKYPIPVLLILVLVLSLSACQGDEPVETTPGLTLPVSSPNQTYNPGTETQRPDPTSTTAEDPLEDYPFAPELTGIYLTRDGKIQSAEVTDFDNSPYPTARYSPVELKTFVEKRVAAYNADNGQDAVKIERLEVKDKTAELVLSYKTMDDFMNFQGAEFGVKHLNLLSREDAIRKYDVKNLVDTKGNKADLLTALAARDSRVLVIVGKTHVTVNGDIGYLSENMILTGNNSAHCDSDQGYSYIIFR